MKKTSYDFLEPDESIVMEGNANMHQLLGITKGGTLILTDRRLVFLAHALNFGRKFDEIPFSMIAVSGNELNILVPTSNMIKVVTRDGKKYEFIVVRKQKEEWKQKISELVRDYRAS